MDIDNVLVNASLVPTQEKEPLTQSELQFELMMNPNKYNDFDSVAVQDILDRYQDEYQQLYWMNKAVINVCRENKLSVRASKWYAARNASKILEAFKAKG